MPTTLDQYRDAKNSYLKLKNQAKKELLARFHELTNELYQVQRELLEDFGEKVAMPSAKGSKRLKPVKKALPTPEPKAPAAPSPEVIALAKQIEKQRAKLEQVRAAGKPTKALEDRLYELEDAHRLKVANS
jgi:hypothetical protein